MGVTDVNAATRRCATNYINRKKSYKEIAEGKLIELVKPSPRQDERRYVTNVLHVSCDLCMIQGICTRPSEGFTLCTPNPTKYTPRLAKTRDKKETKSHKKGENKTPPRHRTPNHSTQGSSRSIAALICAYYLGTTVLLPPMNPFHGEAANLFTEHFERRPYLPPRTSHNGWLRTNTPRPSRKMGYFHNYL